MTSEEFWAELKKHGFTVFRVLPSEGGIRTVLLQSADGQFPSIEHPDDLTPEQRVAILSRFLRNQMIV